MKIEVNGWDKNVFDKIQMTGYCWLWLGKSRKDGYGEILRGGRYLKLHRWVYSSLVGPIPGGMYVCHRCDNPKCVRPSHLFIGNQKDNMIDCSRKERAGNRKLTWDNIRCLREQRNGGVGAAVLSDMFGISESHVYRIIKKERWHG